jgi:zinc protease
MSRHFNLPSLLAWIAVISLATVFSAYSGTLDGNVKRFKLSNGLDVLIKEDHANKVATIQYWVMVGSADEEQRELGISHLIEHMAFKGTERRGVGNIASEIEALGGRINAYTSWDQTVFHVTLPSSKTGEGMDILTDAVLRPAIDPAELEKEKKVVLEEILEGKERPERKASQLLFDTAYVESPYKFPIIGYKETVENLTRDDILAFRKKWYVPENMFVLIVGDVDSAQVKAQIQQLTAELKPQGFFRPARSAEPNQKEILASLVRDGNARETHLNIAFHIPSAQSNDMHALDLAADILGGTEGSRLVGILKKEKGLVHSISTSTLTHRMSGLFVISALLDAKNVVPATHLVMEEIARLANEPPSPEELQRVKVQMESQHVYARESVQGMARSIGGYASEFGDPNYEEKSLRLSATVTPEELSQAVKRYLEPPNVSVSVLAPEDADAQVTTEVLKKTIASIDGRKEITDTKVSSREAAQNFTLPNGVRVVLVPDGSNPVATARIAYLGGKRFETKSTEGIMNFIAQMLTKGTTKMFEMEILRKLEDMGGKLVGFSGHDSFGLSGTFFSRHLEDGLQLLAHLSMDSAFPSDKVERERSLILNQIKTEPDRPIQYAISVLNQTLFPSHPYGFNTGGKVKSVSGFSRDELKRAYERFSVPSNTVITVVGDMDSGRVKALIGAIFGKIPARTPHTPEVAQEHPLNTLQEKIVRIPRAKAHLAIGFRGTTLSDEDRYPLEVLNNILAGQGGRLFTNLRDKESLAYTVTSFDRPGLDTGLFAVYMACEETKVDRAVTGLLQEIQKLRENSASETELNRSINNIIGNHLIALQSSAARAENIGSNTLYGLGHDYEKHYLKKIADVKADDVLRVAKKYLDPERSAMVKILPEVTQG